MKNQVSKQLWKYGILLLANILIFVGFTVITIAEKNYIIAHRNEFVMLPIVGYGDVYLLFAFPLYGLLHGIISFVLTKNVWLPSLILFIISWIGFPISYSLFPRTPQQPPNAFSFAVFFDIRAFLFPLILTAISLLFAFLSWGAWKLIKKSQLVGEADKSKKQDIKRLL